MFAFGNGARFPGSILALLPVVLPRMFFHYVSLERKGSIALEVAVITGKRFLASVCSHVQF